MREKTFPLFQSHLDLAHFWWKRIVTPESIVIDATCGNGHDSLFLSRLRPKHLLGIDVQREAIETTRERVKDIELFQMSHETFPDTIEKESVTLIVYNLGYLPGADKSLTTQTDTTLNSLKAATKLMQKGGMISVTCYPGHKEGKKEEQAVLECAKNLDPREWNVCHHTFSNRKEAPSLLFIQRSS